MGFNNRTTMYVSSAKHNALPQWAASTSYTAGTVIRQLTAAYNTARCWIALTSGTSGGTEPTWTTGAGDKITDGGVTWIECSGAAPLNETGPATSCPNWVNGAKGGGISQGHFIVDAAATHVFVCSTAGTSGSGTEPTWNTTAIGNTTTDNTVTWTYLGTVAGMTKWGAPLPNSYLLYGNVGNTNWNENAGGPGQVSYIFYGNNHNESSVSSGINMNAGTDHSNHGPAFIACVNEAGNVPPQHSDITTGATVAVPSGQNLSVNGYLTMYGMTLALSGTGGNQINLNGDHNKEFINCTFNVASTNGGCSISLASTRNSGRTVFRGCAVTFAAASQYISMQGCVRWYGGSIGATGTAITGNLFNQSDICDIVIKGADLSNALGTGTPYIATLGGQGGQMQLRFEDCKMPTNMSSNPVSVNHIYAATQPNSFVEFVRCGAGYEYAKYSQPGQVVTNSQTARSGGASDGTTSYGLEIITDATYIDSYQSYLELPTLVQWNSTTGASVTATVYGISWDSALPTNNEVWLEVSYEGDSTDTISTRNVTRIADYLSTPSSASADTSHWDSGASARANSTAYTAGQFIADPAGNGRLYMCTTAGTTAASLPGGYSTAVDGTAVTDGTAVFTAGYRFSISATLTSPFPAKAGNVETTVCFGKAGSKTYAIDPLVVL